MSATKCITNNSLNRTRDEDIRNIREIQDDIRWARIRRCAWRDHVKRMDDERLAKIARNGNQTSLGDLDGLQNVGAKVGHRHHRRTGTLDKIQNMVYSYLYIFKLMSNRFIGCHHLDIKF